MRHRRLATAILLLAASAAGADPAARHRPLHEHGWRAIPASETAAVVREPRESSWMTDIVSRAAAKGVAEIGGGKVAPEEVWATAIDCRDPWDPRMGSYQGDALVYPASVIKLCYMVAAFDQNRTRGLALDEEMRADLEIMIQESDNKATNRILERLTNTGLGPDLEGEALESFLRKRRLVTAYFEGIGLDGFRAESKTYEAGIRLEGREKTYLGAKAGDNFEQSNMMATDDTARLLYGIHRRAIVDAEACEEMLRLMHRTEAHPTNFSKILPEGAVLHSKSGFAGPCRHDAGIIRLADGGAVILVVFTKTRNVEGGGEWPKMVERVGELILADVLAQPALLDQATAEESAALDAPVAPQAEAVAE